MNLQEIRKSIIAESFIEADIQKAKYFRREGSPGNYKYYYTKEEYEKSKAKDSKETKSPNKGTIRLKDDKDMPLSMWSLQGKDLKVKDTKTYQFASGPQTYYVVENDGEEIEVPERFLISKSEFSSNQLNELITEHKELIDVLESPDSVDNKKEAVKQKKELADYEQQLKKGKDDPCWDGYEQFGMKTKDGKKVPNCVPEKKGNISKSEALEILGLSDFTDFEKI